MSTTSLRTRSRRWLGWTRPPARRDVLAADGLPDARAVDPLARLGRAEWSRLGEVIALDRIRYDDWRTGRRSG